MRALTRHGRIIATHKRNPETNNPRSTHFRPRLEHYHRASKLRPRNTKFRHRRKQLPWHHHGRQADTPVTMATLNWLHSPRGWQQRAPWLLSATTHEALSRIWHGAARDRPPVQTPNRQSPPRIATFPSSHPPNPNCPGSQLPSEILSPAPNSVTDGACDRDSCHRRASNPNPRDQQQHATKSGARNSFPGVGRGPESPHPRIQRLEPATEKRT